MKLLQGSLVLLALLFATGCEREMTLHFINETDEDVDILVSWNGREDAVLLPARDTLDFGVFGLFEDFTYHIEARIAGRSIFAEEVTFDELERREFRIVIPRDSTGKSKPATSTMRAPALFLLQ